jgi:hypothetical protein
MKADIVTKEHWIIAQLAGIQMMEQELKSAFEKPGARTVEELGSRLAQLNSWLECSGRRSGPACDTPSCSGGIGGSHSFRFAKNSGR